MTGRSFLHLVDTKLYNFAAGVWCWGAVLLELFESVAGIGDLSDPWEEMCANGILDVLIEISEGLVGAPIL